jgi:hypothetical protein
VESPPAPEGYVPTSIFDVVPAVRALLATSPVVPDHPVLQEPDKRLP